MSKIRQAFKNKKKCFIPFITGGDPNLEVSKELILAMAAAGADIIEIGIPFSDPVAEGEVIQRANVRALNAGTTTDKLFDMLAEVRNVTQVPLVFLTYVNPIFIYGTERFMENAVSWKLMALSYLICLMKKKMNCFLIAGNTMLILFH